MLLSWQSHSVRMLNYRAISRWVQAEKSCRQANCWVGQPLYFRFVCITWSFCVFQWPMGNRLDVVIFAWCKMFKHTVYWRLSLKKLILEQNFIIRLSTQRTQGLIKFQKHKRNYVREARRTCAQRRNLPAVSKTNFQTRKQWPWGSRGQKMPTNCANEKNVFPRINFLFNKNCLFTFTSRHTDLNTACGNTTIDNFNEHIKRSLTPYLTNQKRVAGVKRNIMHNKNTV